MWNELYVQLLLRSSPCRMRGDDGSGPGDVTPNSVRSTCRDQHHRERDRRVCWTERSPNAHYSGLDQSFHPRTHGRRFHFGQLIHPGQHCRWEEVQRQHALHPPLPGELNIKQFLFSKQKVDVWNLWWGGQLAVADLLVSIWCLSGEAAWTYTVEWKGGQILCKIFKFSQVKRELLLYSIFSATISQRTIPMRRKCFLWGSAIPSPGIISPLHSIRTCLK